MESIEINPDCIRFTHSRIRPFFSGCGKRIEDSILELKSGCTKIEDIPQITVIENEGEFYSLNNRRLYMFKFLNREGLLPKGVIRVFKKKALDREIRKYSIENCSLTAVLMKELTHGDDSKSNLTLCTSIANSELYLAPYNPKNMNSIVRKALTDMKKLAVKGKIKPVLSQLDEWILNGLVTEGQELEYIKKELNIA